MDLKIFEYILTAAEKKSITKAAEIHFISQPTLSQHIRNVEKRYGIKIFEKVSNKLVPTQEGEIFLSNAENMIKVMDRTEKLLNMHAHEYFDNIRIFTDMYWQNRFIHNIQPVFEEKYPSVKISIVIGDTESAYKCMEGGIVDGAVILTNQPLPASFDGIILNEEEMMLVSSEALHEGDLNRILSEQTAYLLKNHSFYSHYGNELLKTNHIPYKEICYCDHMTDIFTKIRTDGGFTFAPKSYISFYGHESLPAVHLNPPAQFHFVFSYHHRNGMTAPLRCLLDICRQYFSK